jgi:hypothetical protein
LEEVVAEAEGEVVEAVAEAGVAQAQAQVREWAE